jgi:hypothetical protein
MKQSVQILKKWGCLGPTELVLLIALPFGVWMFMRYGYNVGNGKALRIVDANTVVIQNDKGKEETVHLAGIDAPERDQPDGVAEGRARVEGQGLWGQANPTAPWIWRETHKEEREAADDNRQTSKSP